MKKYELDVSKYEVDFERWVMEDEKRVLKTGKEPLKVKEEIADMLRIPGIYENGIESFDGLMLGREIRASEEDSFSISEDELNLLKKVMDKLIGRDHNPAAGQISLGGPRYEEMIIRVYGLGRE